MHEAVLGCARDLPLPLPGARAQPLPALQHMARMQAQSAAAEMDRQGVSQAALLKESRKVIRAALTQQNAPEAAAPAAQPSAEQSGAEVDPAVVEGVNCSDKKAAEFSVGLVFLLRWLQLHGQVCRWCPVRPHQGPCCLSVSGCRTVACQSLLKGGQTQAAEASSVSSWEPCCAWGARCARMLGTNLVQGNQ